MLVEYETPVPSGKKVVPLTGGVHGVEKGVIVTLAVRLDDWPIQMGLGAALRLIVGVVDI